MVKVVKVVVMTMMVMAMLMVILHTSGTWRGRRLYWHPSQFGKEGGGKFVCALNREGVGRGSPHGIYFIFLMMTQIKAMKNKDTTKSRHRHPFSNDERTNAIATAIAIVAQFLAAFNLYRS